jgi:hypothetical protein
MNTRKEHIMASGAAYVNAYWGSKGLSNNVEEIIVTLPVKSGTFLIFGRVVVFNTDGAAQNSGAKITSGDGGNLIDRVDLRIPGDSSQALALQGTLVVKSENTDKIDIRCSTYRGSGGEASLFALEVSQFETA